MDLITVLEGLSLIAILAVGVYAAAMVVLVVLILGAFEPALRRLGSRAKELAIFCLLCAAVAAFKATRWLGRFLAVHAETISKARAWGALILCVVVAVAVVLIGTLAIGDALFSPGKA